MIQACMGKGVGLIRPIIPLQLYMHMYVWSYYMS